MLFWYLVKSDLSGVRFFSKLYSSIHWNSIFLQSTRNKRPCIICHPVNDPRFLFLFSFFEYYRETQAGDTILCFTISKNQKIIGKGFLYLWQHNTLKLDNFLGFFCTDIFKRFYFMFRRCNNKVRYIDLLKRYLLSTD